MSESQSQYLNMLNNYMERSLIYRIREHSINQNLGSAESARSGISEVRMGTQQGNVYMNGKHRKAGSERYNKPDLDYRWDPGLEVDDI